MSDPKREDADIAGKLGYLDDKIIIGMVVSRLGDEIAAFRQA